MKITILGSGSACGIPAVGNSYGKVDKNNKKNIRTRSSAYFECEEGSFIVECGPDFRYQVCKKEITDIHNIFISHGHADHIMGIWELSKYSVDVNRAVDLWGNKETLDEIKSRFSFMFKNENKKRVNLNIIEPLREFSLPDTKISLLPLEFFHQDKHSMGFKFKNMVYTPDFSSFPDTTSDYLYDLDLWILELTSREDIKRGHNYIEQMFSLLDKYRPKKCVLNHLSDDIDYDEVSRIFPDNIKLAYDNMVINL